MESEILDAVREWSPHPAGDGYAGLHDLADERFSGAVTAGDAWAFLLNGRVVGVFEGTVEDFEAADLDAHVAPDESLPLLYAMQLGGPRTRAKYYTNETPLSEVDETLSEGGFTGYVELSENVLSGDYYVVYYGGKSMSAAFIGNSRRLVTGDDAFERANDEVGIYAVNEASIDVVDVPEPPKPELETDSDSDSEPKPEPETESESEASTDVEAVTIDAEDDDEAVTIDAEDDEAVGVDAEAESERTAAGSDETAEPLDSEAPSGDAATGSDENAAVDGMDTGDVTDEEAAETAEVTEEPTTDADVEEQVTNADVEERSADADVGPSDSETEPPAGGGTASDEETGDVTPESDSGTSMESATASESEASTGGTSATADVDSSTQSEPEGTSRLDEAPGTTSSGTSSTVAGDDRDSSHQRTQRTRPHADAPEASRRESDVEPERTLSPEEALAETNLFVRYETKSAGTLQGVHEGQAARESVDENLVLDYHVNVDTEGLYVDGAPYEAFLRGNVRYEFVRWLVTDLFYEIRDTGSRRVLDRLYDAIPDVDRIEFATAIEGAGGEHAFDVVCYDKMGNPLFVADVNDSRDPTTREMMQSLVDRATTATEAADSLAAAFSLTTSYFGPDAMEVAADATGGGLFSRTKRKSYVKISRKRGFHLCLAEARDGGFYLSVPDL